MTLEQLAARLGTSAGHLHKWETGKVSVNLNRLSDIAEILGTGIANLVDSEPKVPVVASVGPEASLVPPDMNAAADRLYTPCPLGLDPQHTLAVSVQSDSLLPIDRGWLLFFTRSDAGIPDPCIGNLCVVQLADDGSRLVRRLQHGRSPARFNLYGAHVREMEDVPLSWAAVIRDARPPTDT